MSGATIQDILDRCKPILESLIDDWGLIMIILLVALGSFGLGRISTFEAAKPPVSISEAPSEAKPRGLYLGGQLVASRTGHSYFYPWCGSVKNITTQNRVWFKSESEARDWGYEPAKNCKGLTASDTGTE